MGASTMKDSPSKSTPDIAAISNYTTNQLYYSNFIALFQFHGFIHSNRFGFLIADQSKCH